MASTKPKSISGRVYLESAERIARGENYLRAVLVEDDPLQRKMLREIFYDLSTQIEVLECDTLENAFRYLERGGIDVVLLDLNLPDSGGVDTFDMLSSRFPQVPIIVASNDGELELAMNLVERGAADYVLKSEAAVSIFRRVVLAVKRWKHTVPASRDIAKRYRQIEKAEAKMTSAKKSGQWQLADEAKIERDLAAAGASKAIISEVMDITKKIDQTLGKLDELGRMVKAHDDILVRGTSDRPGLRHEVREIKTKFEELRTQVEQLDEQLDEREDEDRATKLELEHQKRYSTEKWAFWQKAVAVVAAVITTLISAYFGARDAKKAIDLGGIGDGQHQTKDAG